MLETYTNDLTHNQNKIRGMKFMACDPINCIFSLHTSFLAWCDKLTFDLLELETLDIYQKKN